MRKFMLMVAVATFFFGGNQGANAIQTGVAVDSLKTGNGSEKVVRGVVGNLLGTFAKGPALNTKDSVSTDSVKDKFVKGRLGDARLGNGGAIGDMLGSIIGGAVQSSKPIAECVVGTWGYLSSKCVLESDDVMKKMGGELMATPIENKLNSTLEKIGVSKGAFSFTFNDDGTFTSKTQSRTANGKYVVDETNKKVTMTYMGGLVRTTMDVMIINHKLSLLYDADKILLFLSAISSKSNSATFKTINKITASYDGMKVGLEFTK